MAQTRDANFRLQLAHETAVAKTRRADTFIWWPTGVLACFNSEVLGPVNVENIQRWTRKLIERPAVSLDVKSVNIEPYNDDERPIYCCPVENSNLPMAELDVLRPGDYGVRYSDASLAKPSLKAEKDPSKMFCTLRIPYPSIGSRMRERNDCSNQIPEDLIIKAKARSQSQGPCVFTGLSGPQTTVHWVLPPSQSDAVSMFQYRPDDIERSDVGFTHVANLVSMRQDLYELFLENAFGIDVEDDFKIRTFHPSAKIAGFPARLNILEPDEHLKFFMDAHFRWCLHVHFHGGNIGDDKQLGEERVTQFMDKLYIDEEEEEEEDKLKEEDWRTPLGKAVFEYFKGQVGLESKLPPCSWVDLTTAEDDDSDEGSDSLGN